MKCLVLIYFILFSMSQTAYAIDPYAHIYDEIGIDSVVSSVPEDAENIIEGYDIATGQGVKEVLYKLGHHLLDSTKEQLQIVWKPAVNTIFVITTLNVISVLFSDKKYNYVITFVGSAIILYLNISDARSMFSDSIRVIRKLYDFSTVLLPCLAGATVLTGATVSAGIKYTAAGLVMNLLLNFSNTVLIPLVSIYMLCIIGDCVFEQKLLGRISNLINWSCKTILKYSVIIFISYLTLSGFITEPAEIFSTKLLKTTLSTGLPVVGKIVSDTASTLVSGAELLRNGIGVFGMFVIICILILPMTSVGVRYFLFKVVSKIAELYPEKRFMNLMIGISEVYGMVFAIIGAGVIMLFFTLLSFMKLSGLS